jgi:hypothetical protein
MNRHNSTFKVKHPKAKPNYPAMLEKLRTKRKPSAMTTERAKPGHVPMLCEVCGALSFVSPRRLRKGPNRCQVHRQRALRAKPDAKLSAWSKAVRTRDDFTCQMTGVRDVARNIAHHVAPRSRRPDLRLNVDNGITLTPEAHQWVHDYPREATAAGWLSSVTYEKAHSMIGFATTPDETGIPNVPTDETAALGKELVRLVLGNEQPVHMCRDCAFRLGSEPNRSYTAYHGEERRCAGFQRATERQGAK